MREPVRFSWKHWWNFVFIVVAALGIAAWWMNLVDGRLVVLAVVLWILVGFIGVRSIMYEHLGFLDRWVFHDYRKARLRYRKAVDTGKATAQGLCSLASLTLAEGDVSEAARLLEEAVTQLPDDPDLFALLSRVLGRQGRYDESVAAALKCRELHPPAPLGEIVMGDALKGKGELVGAASAYQKALEHSPNLPEPHLKLAEIYTQMGDLNAAQREADEALRLSPRDPDAMYWGGKVRSLKGDAGAAARMLNQAVIERAIGDRSLLVPYSTVIQDLAQASLTARMGGGGPHAGLGASTGTGAKAGADVSNNVSSNVSDEADKVAPLHFDRK